MAADLSGPRIVQSLQGVVFNRADESISLNLL